jgi:Na+/glutamate symporter
MQAITERFGPSHLAFVVMPMVRAFFVDIANAIVMAKCLQNLMPIPAKIPEVFTLKRKFVFS